MAPTSSSIYTNPSAKSWTYTHPTDISLAETFHRTLPSYAPTPLIPLDSLASEFNVRNIFVKDESNRFGLPAFKILGASWGVFRVICAHGNFALTTSLDDVATYAAAQGMVLFTATDGNHGRAVARMARLLGIGARVFVPRFTDVETRGRIAGEGSEVEVVGVQGDYDDAVARAFEESGKYGRESGMGQGVFVQDTSFDGYQEIPLWIVEGYATMLSEMERQLDELDLEASVVVTPIGVGSLGHAVVAHCKSDGRQVRVLAIEPERSACLHESLKEGKRTAIETSTTIMDGMNCGSVSPVSWPMLRAGVDASVTISDWESHEAVRDLHQWGVMAGPCGAGALAGLRRVVQQQTGEAIGLSKESVVVLLSTEGDRDYPIPMPKPD